MPLSPAFAAWLRQQGHDSVHASELGLNRASDSEIMVRAKQDSRTVITADLDYPRLLAIVRASEPSVILFRDGAWSETDIIKRMREVLEAVSDKDIAESIIVIERHRVRRRRLPLES
jgi:predicted nuclease of predicted toxin-antitoxin system